LPWLTKYLIEHLATKIREEIITMTDIDPKLIALSETVPGGAYWSGVIKRGNTLQITDLAGSQGALL
jgi:uncharacterized protein